MRLTSAGEKLVEELREPFARIEQSFFSVRDTAGPVRGLVRITAPVAFARQQLVPIIGEFLRDYPQVRLQLDVTDRIVSLSSGKAALNPYLDLFAIRGGGKPPAR